ncbi:unnamed protein product [Parajaminaea phylloscopi]
MTSTPNQSASSPPLSHDGLQRLRAAIPRLTVVELKGVIRDVGEACRTRLAISGTKPQLINRLTDQLASWAASSSWNNVAAMKRFVEHPRDSKGYLLDPSGPNGHAAWAGQGAHQTASPYAANSSAGYYSAMQQGASSGYQKLTPGAGPSRYSAGHRPGPHSGYVGQGGTATAASKPAHQVYLPSSLAFRSSPFWRIEQFVSAPVLLSEAGPQVRKTSNIDLKLDSRTIGLLKAADSAHQVRLFCTPKVAADVAERNPASPAPVEFPASCEARINGHLYSSSLKGSKKSPGRVPPPNLNKDKTLMTRDGMVNKIELVYANAAQKYVMVVALCAITSVDTIVARLIREKKKSREEIVGSMKRAAAEDDIEIGTSTLSLRDPLSYTRIQNPCRSTHCHHSQCFDASFFFMSNEQAPTWQCPHCSKALKPEDLFIDGYFEDILRKVPEGEDAVDVDADGTWRTRDGAVTSGPSDAVRETASLALSVRTSSPRRVAKQEEHQSPGLPPPPQASAASHPEVVLLDDDDDDTPPPPARTSQAGHASSTLNSAVPGQGQARSMASALHSTSSPIAMSISRGGSTAASVSEPHNGLGASANDAIDLTLSESDDEASPPPPPPPPPPTLPAAFRPHQHSMRARSPTSRAADPDARLGAGARTSPSRSAYVATEQNSQKANPSAGVGTTQQQEVQHPILTHHSASASNGYYGASSPSFHSPLVAASNGTIGTGPARSLSEHALGSTPRVGPPAGSLSPATRPFAAPSPRFRLPPQAPEVTSGSPNYSPGYGSSESAPPQAQPTFGNRFRAFLNSTSGDVLATPIYPASDPTSSSPLAFDNAAPRLYPFPPAAASSESSQIRPSPPESTLLNEEGIAVQAHEAARPDRLGPVEDHAVNTDEAPATIDEDDDTWTPGRRRLVLNVRNGKRRRTDTESTVSDDGAAENGVRAGPANSATSATSAQEHSSAVTATDTSSSSSTTVSSTDAVSRPPRRIVIRRRLSSESARCEGERTSPEAPHSSTHKDDHTAAPGGNQEPGDGFARPAHNGSATGDTWDSFIELEDSVLESLDADRVQT